MIALPLLALLATAPETLVVGNLSDPISLDPHQATDLVSGAIVSAICEPLVRDRVGGVQHDPALATAWATSDNRVWTFTLRDRVRFHDGTPFDADAVVANIAHLRKVRAFRATAERAGRLTVVVILDQPNAALLSTLAQPFFTIVSPKELASKQPRAVGTGPFRLGSARPGLVELLANPDHWEGRPRLARVQFRRLASEDALVQGMLSGEVDVSSALTLESHPRLEGNPDVVVHTRPGRNLAYLALNNERPPLRDPRVRQAVAVAIDRSSLVSNLLQGHGEPARNPLPPSFWGYATRTRELLLDRGAARRLLTRAGLRQGFDATLMTVDASRPYMPAPLRLAARLRDDLAQVGIRLREDVVASWSEYLARGTRGDFDLAVFGWQADTLDPNDFLTTLLSSEAVGSTNRSRYRSPAMDDLLGQARRGTSQHERSQGYLQAQALFQKDMPFVPLYHVAVFTAARRSVQGLAASSGAFPRYEKTWKEN